MTEQMRVRLAGLHKLPEDATEQDIREKIEENIQKKISNYKKLCGI